MGAGSAPRVFWCPGAPCPVTTHAATYPVGRFVPAERTHLVATTADIVPTLDHGSASLSYGLPAAAFRGDGPGADSRPGRIPESVSVPAIELFDPDTGRFRAPAQRASALEAALATPDGLPAIAYCGGGLNATVDLIALALLGRGDARLYDASLAEWSPDPSLPLALG